MSTRVELADGDAIHIQTKGRAISVATIVKGRKPEEVSPVIMDAEDINVLIGVLSGYLDAIRDKRR
jgi:hypothetical protein